VSSEHEDGHEENSQRRRFALYEGPVRLCSADDGPEGRGVVDVDTTVSTVTLTRLTSPGGEKSSVISHGDISKPPRTSSKVLPLLQPYSWACLITAPAHKLT